MPELRREGGCGFGGGDVSTNRRRTGGTDVGPIVALYRPELAPELAKWANATDVAMRLIYEIERPRTAVMSRGLGAEPRLRKAYLDAYGGNGTWAFVAKPEKWIVPHPALPWATCSPDDARTDGVLVEYKSTSIFARHKWGDAESDEVPPLYGLQVQWCLEILDLPRADLFVGFGRDFTDENEQHQFLYEETRVFHIDRDRELAAMAIDYCQRFQTDFIEGRKLPPLAPVHNKRAYSQLLKGTHPCLTQTAAPSPS
jgi:hypothetical protein